ncbi:hypothetical protein ACFLUR_01910 [Chloroflexota bacterium]
MGRPERLRLIQSIEAARDGNKLICLVTGDRRGLETKIAIDILPFLYEHLSTLGQMKSVDLFIYTAGGDSIAGWGLVNLVREFCDKMNVIIPFRALSCGTLIALGAHEILMSRGGQLSPVDPSVSSPYNPTAPGQQGPGRISLLPVSVEDMMAYLRMAGETGNPEQEDVVAGKAEKLITEDNTANMINTLSNKVHPLALGAAYRAREQGAMLASRLMKYHENDKEKIQNVVGLLTKALPTHNYLIGKKEAKGIIGLPIVDMDTDLEPLVWGLYKQYEDWFELRKPYNAEAVLGSSQASTAGFPRAALESVDGTQLRSHVFTTTKELKRVQSTQPGIPIPIVGIQERIMAEEWVEDYS